MEGTISHRTPSKLVISEQEWRPPVGAPSTSVPGTPGPSDLWTPRQSANNAPPPWLREPHKQQQQQQQQQHSVYSSKAKQIEAEDAEQHAMESGVVQIAHSLCRMDDAMRMCERRMLGEEREGETKRAKLEGGDVDKAAAATRGGHHRGEYMAAGIPQVPSSRSGYAKMDFVFGLLGHDSDGGRDWGRGAYSLWESEEDIDEGKDGGMAVVGGASRRGARDGEDCFGSQPSVLKFPWSDATVLGPTHVQTALNVWTHTSFHLAGSGPAEGMEGVVFVFEQKRAGLGADATSVKHTVRMLVSGDGGRGASSGISDSAGGKGVEQGETLPVSLERLGVTFSIEPNDCLLDIAAVPTSCLESRRPLSPTHWAIESLSRICDHIECVEKVSEELSVIMSKRPENTLKAEVGGARDRGGGVVVTAKCCTGGTYVTPTLVIEVPPEFPLLLPVSRIEHNGKGLTSTQAFAAALAKAQAGPLEGVRETRENSDDARGRGGEEEEEEEGGGGGRGGLIGDGADVGFIVGGVQSLGHTISVWLSACYESVSI